MSQTAILLVCAVLAAAISLATSHSYFPDQYLDLSLFPKDWELNIEGTKKALIELDVLGCKTSDVLQKLKNSVVQRSTEHSNQVYKDLIDLSRSYQLFDYSVVFRVVNRLIEICKILNDFTFNGEKEIAGYLAEYGQPWFTDHFREVSYQLKKENAVHYLALQALDKLFANFYHLKKYTDTAQVEMLSKADLVEGTFDVANGLKIALHLEKWEESEKRRPLYIILSFLYRKCNQLREDREVYINALAFSFTFHSCTWGISKMVEKLKEYNRLCASLRRDQDRVVNNLGRQINWMDWPNHAVLDLDLLIQAFLGLEPQNDDVMLRILTTLDLTTRDLNVQKAIEVALNLERWDEAEKRDPIYTLIVIIFKKCAHLQIGSELKIYQDTLASRSRYHPENLPIEVKKWIEYDRFCKRLHGSEFMVYNNLARHVNLQGSNNQESVQPTTIDFLSQFK